MADKTGIQWTNATWNPTIGCAKVSEGCRNCYAMSQAARIVAMERGNYRRSPYEDVVKMGECKRCGGTGVLVGKWATGAEARRAPCPPCNGTGKAPLPRWNGRAMFLPERLDQPLRWQKPRRVFVNSMSDLFHEDLSFEEIAAVFGVMAATPRHTFQVLTKRPERALEFFEWLRSHGASVGGYAAMGVAPSTVCVRYARDYTEHSGVAKDCHQSWPLRNVWLGVSAEDQKTADERIPLLLQCPAAVRFVSAEPLLAPIDFITGRINHFKAYKEAETVTDLQSAPGGRPFGVPRAGRGWVHYTGAYPDWVIVGGESGPGARECDVAWIRSIVEQCSDAGIPAFVKQLGAQPFEWQQPSGAPSDEWDERPLRLADRKGGDPQEWPEDLRVRQFPNE